MITKTFRSQEEIKKIQCIFTAIKNNWKDKGNILLEFRHFENVFPTGEMIDGYMNEMLFKYKFCDFLLFAAVIKTNHITFWLTITEEDETSSLVTIFQAYLENLEEKGEPGPHVVTEIELWDARKTIWEIYNFFDSSTHFAWDAETKLRNILAL